MNTPDTQIQFTKDDLVKLLAECMNNISLWNKTFFPEIFYNKFSSMHYQTFKLLDNPTIKKVVAAPRGFGKTSIVSYGLATRDLLLGKANFLVYISSSLTLAEMITENIKKELLSNSLMRSIFGDIRVSTNSDLEEQFSRRAWILNRPDGSQAIVVPRGQGQQIRGLLYSSMRPDLIIYDDLENKAELTNPEIRNKLAIWFWSDPLKCGSRFRPDDLRHIYIDTVKHGDSLIKKLLNHPAWDSLELEACDVNLNPTDPTFMSAEMVRKEYEEHKAAGRLDVFHQEFRNKIVAPEDASFSKKDFRYFNINHTMVELFAQENQSNPPLIEEPKIIKKLSLNDFTFVVIVDPAKTSKMQSDYTSIGGYGLSSSRRLILITEMINKRFYPEQVYREAYLMAQRIGANNIGVEIDTLGDFITIPFKEYLNTQDSFIQLIELKSGNIKKEKRISALSPYYSSGMIYHRIGVCDVLEAQLLDFPYSTKDDASDNAAYILRMMNSISFSFVSQAVSEYSNDPDGYETLLRRDKYDNLNPMLDLDNAAYFGDCF